MSHSLNTYYLDLSPYNTRERTCIISCTIRAGRPWAHGKNILDYNGWAGRNIITDAGGWAEVVGYNVDGCIKVDCVSDRLICEGYLLSHLRVGPDAYLIRRMDRGDYKILN